MSLTIGGVDPARRDQLALADERVTYDWHQLDERLNRAANALNGLDLTERRVAVFAPNSAETVIAYVACLEAGISSVPVSFHLTPSEAAYILKDSGAVALLVTALVPRSTRRTELADAQATFAGFTAAVDTVVAGLRAGSRERAPLADAGVVGERPFLEARRHKLVQAVRGPVHEVQHLGEPHVSCRARGRGQEGRGACVARAGVPGVNAGDASAF